MKNILGFVSLTLFILAGCSVQEKEQPAILIFSKTEGYRHQSIEHGANVIAGIAAQQGYRVVHTEDASVFNEDSLRSFGVVVFLNTTGDVLDHYQQADFKRFIQAGGGFIGIHAAADTEYQWPWYGKLVGGYFNGHPNNPNVREAIVRKVTDHQLLDSIPQDWTRNDEWYDYKEINPTVNVLQNIDESTYEGGKMGDNHPISWYHEFDGGRAFYTGMGHTAETYDEELYQKLIINALNYVASEQPLDYKKATSYRVPEENRFTKVVLDFNLNEPTELDFLPDGKVIFAERKGNVKLYLPDQDTTLVINKLDVFSELEDGLVGLAVDPNFEQNHWVYLYYSPADKSVNRLSRFEFLHNSLLMNSEQMLLEVPVQREECCHTGGSIAFDADGNLFLSTGDNSSSFASNGYAPIDERPGRGPFDAQKSSSNTNDLRGKVLRINPEPNGSYTIPEGNLFPAGTPNTRPEIYTMGTRNPYRISVDQKNGTLYWGDIGPDASEPDSTKGPKGYDEINQAKEPGFYGWPYFVGNNYPFQDFDFEAQKSMGEFDPEAPVNDSPNNTGLNKLPPAKPAYIWYPYSSSPEFPRVRDGGRNAMAGPVYYDDLYPVSQNRFPSYYNGKLFIYDWMRNWIFAVNMDEQGKFISMEPFMSNTRFNNIMDMEISPDGTMYILEYGSGWFQQNIDARLVRIDYNGGNRNPVINLSEKEFVGQTPLQVDISAEESIDPDKDKLSFTWYIGKEKVAEGKSFSYSFDQDGIYLIRLEANDSKGGVTFQDIIVRAGNAPPKVEITVEGNSTFYWDGRKVNYEVQVSDKEDGSTVDGSIPAEEVQVFHDFLERGYDMTEIKQGHQKPSTIALGQQLLENSDCLACHKVEGKSIGPSYKQIAERYKDDKSALTHLSKKIINGGSGAWGEVAMSAHPEMTDVEAGQIVQYILSIGSDKKADLKPLKGTIVTDKHKKGAGEGLYFITATYEDKGKEYGRLQTTGQLMLRNPYMRAKTYTLGHEIAEFGLPDGQVVVSNIKDGSWLMYEDIDLTDVNQLMFMAELRESTLAGGTINARIGGAEGEVIGSFVVPGNGNYEVYSMDLKSKSGKHDLYLTFQNPEAEDETLMFLHWIQFKFNQQKLL